MGDGTDALRKMHRDGAGRYCILVLGLVGRHWEPELQMRLAHLRTPLGETTTLTGTLPDQSALLGALDRLTMWGYLILEVRYEAALPAGNAPLSAERPR